MKKRIVLRALVFALALLLCACSAGGNPSASTEKAWGDAQRLYRNASLVITGECLQNHTDENGAACSDVTVGAVLAGNAETGALIHCPGAAMKTGTQYLLYLSADNSAVYYTEDASGFSLLTDAPLAISEAREVSFEGVRLSLEDIERDMRAQDAVITAFADSYYYKNIESLAQACDEIFIGKIESVPALRNTAFRMTGEGSVIENTLMACVMDVTAYGSVKGAARYGDKYRVVYCPSLCDDMTDAATLKSLTYTGSDATAPVKSGVYLFFLVSSPDGKQDYCFAVNGIQGFVALDTDDQVHANARNMALTGYFNLEVLVDVLKDSVA